MLEFDWKSSICIGVTSVDCWNGTLYKKDRVEIVMVKK